MGRPPCCDEIGVKKGPWTPEEDEKLINYIRKHGRGITWRTLPKQAGLNRCGKSCRLRWENYLRPDIKRGKFTEEEERIIINLHSVLGNKWAKIATHLPRRTDNEIKNFWNTNLRKKLLQIGIDPETHKPRTDINHLMNLSQMLGMSNLNTSMINPLGLQPDVTQLARIQLLQNMLQIMNSNSFLNIQNPYLLANQSLNPLLQTFLNGSNTEQIFRGQENLYSDNPDLLFSQQDVFKSGPEIHEDEPNNLEFVSDNKTSNVLEENGAENLLPALVDNTAQVSNQSPNTVFEAWEKFLFDDETNGSYWKDILDLTSTSESSPISW